MTSSKPTVMPRIKHASNNPNSRQNQPTSANCK